MRATEAAIIIGCTPQEVRYLVRIGKLRASRQPMPGGFYWEVHASDVHTYACKPQTQGFPRGKHRKNQN